jgi:hypothetical protein
VTQNLVHDSWSFCCLPIDEMILKMTSALFTSTPCSRKKSATLSVPCLHLQCRKVWRWHHNTSPIQRADCVYNCREAWQYLSLSVTDLTQVHCCFTSKPEDSTWVELRVYIPTTYTHLLDVQCKKNSHLEAYLWSSARNMNKTPSNWAVQQNSSWSNPCVKLINQHHHHHHHHTQRSKHEHDDNIQKT